MHQGHLPSPAGSWKTSRDGSGLDADGSTSTAHKQQPTNTKINTTIVGLNDRRERQATTIGEKVGMELVREIRFWVPKESGAERLGTKGLKDRDPRVGGKRSAGNGIRSAQAGKTRVGRHGSARTKRYAIWNWSAGQGKITRLKDWT